MKKITTVLLVGIMMLPSITMASNTMTPEYRSLLIQLLALLEQELAIMQSQVITVNTTPMDATSTPNIGATSAPTSAPTQTPVSNSVPSIPAVTVDLVIQDFPTYTVGSYVDFLPIVKNGSSDYPSMQFTTDSPDGFNRVFGGQPSPTNDQTFTMAANGTNGVIRANLNTVGTWTYTLTTEGVSKTVSVTVK